MCEAGGGLAAAAQRSRSEVSAFSLIHSAHDGELLGIQQTQEQLWISPSRIGAMTVTGGATMITRRGSGEYGVLME